MLFVHSFIIWDPAHNNVFWHLFPFQSCYSSNFIIFGSVPKNRRRRNKFKRYVYPFIVILLLSTCWSTSSAQLRLRMIALSGKSQSLLNVKLHNRDSAKGKEENETFMLQKTTRKASNIVQQSQLYISFPHKLPFDVAFYYYKFSFPFSPRFYWTFNVCAIDFSQFSSCEVQTWGSKLKFRNIFSSIKANTKNFLSCKCKPKSRHFCFDRQLSAALCKHVNWGFHSQGRSNLALNM